MLDESSPIDQSTELVNSEPAGSFPRPAGAPDCGRRTRSGAPCKNVAGFKTVNLGQGACYLHGGLQDGDRRLKHGRYSIERGGITHPRIADLYAQFADDPDPLNLFDEIAMLRALTVDYIERHADMTDALLAWYADLQGIPTDLPVGLVAGLERAADIWSSRLKETGDWTPELERSYESWGKLLASLKSQDTPARPKRVPDIADATRIIDAIGRCVERIEKMRANNAVSEAELSRIIHQMGRVVDVLVADDTMKEKIQEGWLAIVTR